MKYPVLSNWISYEKNPGSDVYLVKNYLTDDECEMEKYEIEYLESLDGKTNPRTKLLAEFDMTTEEVDDYLEYIEECGIVRKGNILRIGKISFLLTVIKVKNSEAYRKRAITLLKILLFSFIPVTYMGIRSLEKYLLMDVALFMDLDPLLYILGIILGIIVGAILHELAHGVSAVAFGGKVIEFGFMFNRLPGAYTMMDIKTIETRVGKIIIDLAGVMTNLMIASVCMIASVRIYQFAAIFLGVAISNLELALINLLCANGLDGMNAIGQILGKDDISEYYKKLIKKRRDIKKQKNGSEVELWVAYILRITKIVYPILFLFNVCIIVGW